MSSIIYIQFSTNSPDHFVHLEGCGVRVTDELTGDFISSQSFGFLEDGCLTNSDNGFVKRNFGKFFNTFHRAS